MSFDVRMMTGKRKRVDERREGDDGSNEVGEDDNEHQGRTEESTLR